jgi:hypothetical protein
MTCPDSTSIITRILAEPVRPWFQFPSTRTTALCYDLDYGVMAVVAEIGRTPSADKKVAIARGKPGAEQSEGAVLGGRSLGMPARKRRLR